MELNLHGPWPSPKADHSPSKNQVWAIIIIIIIKLEWDLLYSADTGRARAGLQFYWVMLIRHWDLYKFILI